MGGEWGCRCVVRCGILEGRVWVIYLCVYVCIYIYICVVFFFLGVCGIYVFTIHMGYVFLGLGYIQKVRMIVHDRGCSIHMRLCFIQIFIHKCIG